jgi:transposase
MEPEKLKKYNHFIGIDVSRNKLDFAVMQMNMLLFHKEIPNEVADIKSFLIELKTNSKFTIAKALFCMEQTGFYCNHLLECLRKLKANVVLENAYHIKNSFGKSRGKNDKADALRIAQYVYKSRDELKLWEQRRPVIQQLAQLSTLRERLVETHKALKTPLKEQSTFVNKATNKSHAALCTGSLLSIQADIENVEEAINAIIKADERLKHLMGIITSVPSIGSVTALQILITTNEYKDIRCPKKFACYAGVAPFKKESGTMVQRARVSPIANKKMKSLLHICACGVIQYEPELKAYYQRKTETEGMPKMAVLNAIRNKLILRVFACLSQDRPFDKNYQRPTMQTEPVAV